MSPSHAVPVGSPVQSTLRTNVHGGLYLLLQGLRRRPVRRLMRRLEALDRLSRDEFTRRMERRLATTLERARNDVPLYGSGRWREALGAGDPSDLRSWPVLERPDVLERYDELRSRDPGLLDVSRKSSATTGGAVRVAMHPHAAAWQWAWEYHVMRRHGVPLGVPTLVLWGGQAKPFQDRVRNRTFFSATDFTEETLEAVVRAALSGSYPVLWTYPSAAFQLARHLAARSGSREPSFRYVKVGGEPLFSFQREEIEQRLGARVVNFYGANEVGPIAAECPAGSMHVAAENLWVEIFQGEAPAPTGSHGDLVLTSLTNPLMPLVRYRIGDQARLAEDDCGCAWPHPVLRDIQARRADVFRTAEGSEVHASTLTERLAEAIRRAPAAAFRQFAFGRDGERSWTVLVEGEESAYPGVEEEVRRVIRKQAGNDIEVTVRWTPLLPRERSGKFRYFRILDRREPGQASGPSDGDGSGADRERPHRAPRSAPARVRRWPRGAGRRA